MASLFISPSRIICLLVVEWLRVGVGTNISTSETYPDIELYYPPHELPQIRKILEEMRQRHQLPQVHIIDSDGPSYVIVVFRLQGLDKASLNQLFAGVTLPPEVTKTELVMTGEAELPWGRTKPFHELFEKLHYFKLFILDEQKKPMFGVQLHGFKTDWPTEELT